MSKPSERIFLSPPHMTGDEMNYIRQAFETNWIAPLGPHVTAFEKEFASLHGGGHAAAVSSGTAALHLILRILGVEPGDEVVCSTFTFAASVNPVVYLGGTPVFVDSEPHSWNMDPALLEALLKEKKAEGNLPKAVIAVHLYGQCADMDPILNICKRFRVPLVEDAAEALGAKYKGLPAGTMGRASFFSFNGNKILNTSGGGMIWSEDASIVEKARFLSTQARDPAPHYEHSEIGYNYRMSNILAGVGRAQLRALEERVRAKRRIFRYYQDCLSGLPGLTFMPEPEWSYGSRWLSCVLIEPSCFGAGREDVRQAMEAENIECRPLWKPMHLQPVFKGLRVVGGKVSEKLFETGLCLPSGTNMRDEDLERICKIIKKVYKRDS